MFGFLKPGKEAPASKDEPSQDGDGLQATATAVAPAARPGWAERLKAGLRATREQLNRSVGGARGAPLGAGGGPIAGVFGRGRQIDAARFEERELGRIP
ncbi:MAG: hypothetical protein ACK5WE_14130, partial [bacterium]